MDAMPGLVLLSRIHSGIAQGVTMHRRVFLEREAVTIIKVVMLHRNRVPFDVILRPLQTFVVFAVQLIFESFSSLHVASLKVLALLDLLHKSQASQRQMTPALTMREISLCSLRFV
jgi:hypothetical protein